MQGFNGKYQIPGKRTNQPPYRWFCQFIAATSAKVEREGRHLPSSFHIFFLFNALIVEADVGLFSAFFCLTLLSCITAGKWEMFMQSTNRLPGIRVHEQKDYPARITTAGINFRSREQLVTQLKTSGKSTKENESTV